MAPVQNRRAVTYAWIAYLARSEHDALAYRMPHEREPGDDERMSDLAAAADDAYAFAVRHAEGDLDWQGAIRAFADPTFTGSPETEPEPPAGQLVLPF